MTPTTVENPSNIQALPNGKQLSAFREQLNWRDFTWIDGVRYRITERQRVDQWVPKPGDTRRNPELIHVAFMACRVEVA